MCRGSPLIPTQHRSTRLIQRRKKNEKIVFGWRSFLIANYLRQLTWGQKKKVDSILFVPITKNITPSGIEVKENISWLTTRKQSAAIQSEFNKKNSVSKQTSYKTLSMQGTWVATSVKSVGVEPQATVSDMMMVLNLGLSTASLFTQQSLQPPHRPDFFLFLWVGFCWCLFSFEKKNVVLAVLALAMETRLVLNSKRSTWLLLSAGIEVTCTHARTRFIHRAPVSFLLHMGWNPGPLTMDRYSITKLNAFLLF